MAVHLALERVLPASPAAVWPYLTDPALMNRWSSARIGGVDPGDGGGYGAVGALRRVRLPVGRPRSCWTRWSSTPIPASGSSTASTGAARCASTAANSASSPTPAARC